MNSTKNINKVSLAAEGTSRLIQICSYDEIHDDWPKDDHGFVIKTEDLFPAPPSLLGPGASLDGEDVCYRCALQVIGAVAQKWRVISSLRGIRLSNSI